MAGDFNFLESVKFTTGKAPVADTFTGGKSSDVVAMNEYRYCTFVVMRGVSGQATPTYTVESCDDFTPTTSTAIKFKYIKVPSTGVSSGITAATASGYTSSSGSTYLDIIQADAKDMTSGDEGLRLTVAETVDSAILGGILAIRHGSRFAERTAALLS